MSGEPQDVTEAILSEGLLTMREASDQTRVSRGTLYNLMHRGELSFARIGSRRFVPKKAIAELIARGIVLRRI